MSGYLCVLSLPVFDSYIENMDASLYARWSEDIRKSQKHKIDVYSIKWSTHHIVKHPYYIDKL